MIDNNEDMITSFYSGMTTEPKLATPSVNAVAALKKGMDAQSSLATDILSKMMPQVVADDGNGTRGQNFDVYA